MIDSLITTAKQQRGYLPPYITSNASLMRKLILADPTMSKSLYESNPQLLFDLYSTPRYYRLFVKSAATIPKFLQGAPDFVLSNRDTVMAALNFDGLAIKYMPKSVKCDHDAILAAVNSSHGRAFRYATPTARHVHSLAIVALRYRHNLREVFIAYCNKTKEQQNFNIVCAVLKKNVQLITHIDPKFMHNERFIKWIIKSSFDLNTQKMFMVCMHANVRPFKVPYSKDITDRERVSNDLFYYLTHNISADVRRNLSVSA